MWSKKWDRYLHVAEAHIYLLMQVERTVAVLKKRNISVGAGVKSTTYVSVKPESDCSEGKSETRGFSTFLSHPHLTVYRLHFLSYRLSSLAGRMSTSRWQ